MEVVGEGRIWNAIAEGNIQELEKIIKRGINIKTLQGLQLAWAKAERSNYCKEYQYLKLGIEAEAHWDNEGARAKNKEAWARIGCGSMRQSRGRGFREVTCNIFRKNEDENLRHILT